jgi:hypothetical protein
MENIFHKIFSKSCLNWDLLDFMIAMMFKVGSIIVNDCLNYDS